ncbi:hypothetical protein [Azospirillum agricola]|uniref:hypothetical protein n=1 Tax=Azospirillum agricola TaxID=1720247 RepID=UPI000A0F19CB|nr:hypothetical protein [Azospirillum agricola]SMH62841.1 hypothetical protein SAMN02982994_6664 [Azospirillum lipoferum]
MRRCIDTIIHDQAEGPVPDGTPPSAVSVPAEAPAVPPAPEPAAETDPELEPPLSPLAQLVTTTPRRRRPQE